MLERLSVRGLGIIDAVELDLVAGFSVLTGETGAGKSLLVESLKLLTGQRAQTDLVRSGDDRLHVEGVFGFADGSQVGEVLVELGLDDRDQLIVRREVTAAGRSRCWVNDRPTTAGALQALAPHLLAIHGQHEQHGLADTAVQRRLVDEFGGHSDLLTGTRTAFEVWHRAAEEVERLRAAHASRRDRLDTISFQLQEIEAVDPSVGEDDELRHRRSLVRHAARLAELSSSVIEALSDGEPAVVDRLARCERDLEEMVECGLPLEASVELLCAARTQIEEVVPEVRAAVGELAADPGELDALESRLHVLEQLMLKYGSSLDEVHEHRRRLLAERRDLEGVEDRLGDAIEEAAEALADFDRAAGDLHAARVSVGRRLASEVETVLARLEMAGTRIAFEWRTRTETGSPLQRDGAPVAFDADGVEECEVVIAANPGEELRPMAKIASGGELSRVHLALRTVLRRRRPAGGLTLLFDEVDSGLGGSTAAALAELLADLAAVDQVLAVTHLPQVAARAASHFMVHKGIRSGRATTAVERLDDTGRELEVARMLAGDELTESAREHARVLMAER
jgi:DNA repair protein RecN (Recombination protein N)